MKHLFFIIPIVLLFLVNSCVGIPLPSIAANETAVAQTLTAMSWTAMPSPTFNAYVPDMIHWLNNDLAIVSPLGRTLDAEYHVIDISFKNIPNSSDLNFRVDVNCLCINGDQCCLPERTFVVILEAMYRNSNTTLFQVPAGIREVMIVCRNQQTKVQVGAISASWQDVQAYLRKQLSGDQLGVRTTQMPAP